MITCANCHKNLPAGDRFCAYCGTRQPFRLPWLGRAPAWASGTRPSAASWRLGRPIPRHLVMAALGGGLGVLGGAGLGVLLGSGPLGAMLGGLGVGAAAAVAELTAGPIPDVNGAQRFGLVVGVLGGLLALPGGLLVVAAVMVANQGLDGLVFLRGLMQVNFTYGVLGTLVGAAVGTVAGGLLGYYLGLGGYRLGRRGALLGAALAWTLAAGVAGAIAGDYAAQIIGVERWPAARLGVVIQIVAGGVLLYALRPALARLRWWWARKP